MTGILPKLAFISMRKNKARTISTAIGIALAVMLMTVIVILATSISSSMVESAGKKYGNWHITCDGLTQTQLDNMQADGIIDSVCYVKNSGYMQLDEPVNASKPYIHIADVSENFNEYLTCEMISGRMAQNGGEIVITRQFQEDYPDIEINSVIEIDLGQRVSASGKTLWQNASYLGADNESIISTGQKVTFTVVGVIESADSIEYKFSPGYTLLTCGIDGMEADTKVYIKLNNLSANLSNLTKYISEEKIIYNTGLLRYLGVTDGENLQSILISIVSILVIMIGAAAFVLINNSLSSSADERSKQFGVLYSIGMTRAQTFIMFLTEVLAIGLIAIMIGIAVGVAFSYLFLSSVGNIILQASYIDIAFTVSVNFLYIALVALIALIILFIAAVINAAGQMKGSAISKLRANDVIKKTKEKSRRGNAFNRLSVEQAIVFNSFKRYHKKYRYVIISMSLSAVLFVGAGLFGQYADNYIREMMPTVSYDIMVTSRDSEIFDTLDTQYDSFAALDGVDKSGWLCSVSAGIVSLNDISLNTDYKNYAESRGLTTIEATYIIISDESYAAISAAAGISGVFAYDNMTYYAGGEPYTAPLFQGDSAEIRLYYMNSTQRGDYYDTGDYISNSALKQFEIFRISKSDFTMELECLADSGGLYLIIPVSAMYDFVDETPSALQMFFSADDHTSVVQTIEELSGANGWNTSVTDVAESYEKERSTYAMYEIFAMVFTILIAFVAIINAFNSVSANLIKRKNEFAVLQSIGLSNGSLYKMMAYESLLLCGIVIFVTLAFAPCLSALLSCSFAVQTYRFIFPWQYLLIAAVCAFAVFAAAALKPVSAIKRQNVIETIKGNSD